MNKNKVLIIAIIACSGLVHTLHAVRGVSTEETEERMYGRDIAIKNNSPYDLTVMIQGSPNMMIKAYGSQKVMVPTGKKVTIHADVDGKTMKNNFHRKQNTENSWEITVKKGFAGGIDITKRESIERVGFY